MVATVQILENNTVSQTTTDKTAGTIRFKVADNATVDGVNPMVVPSGSPNYSYEKWLQLNVTVAPVTNITNLRVYSDGANSFGTGVLLYAKSTTASFSTPVLGTTLSGFTDFFTYTSGSSLTTAASSATTFTGTGAKGFFLVMVMQVSSTATQGALSVETLTWSYDET